MDKLIEPRLIPGIGAAQRALDDSEAITSKLFERGIRDNDPSALIDHRGCMSAPGDRMTKCSPRGHRRAQFG